MLDKAHVLTENVLFAGIDVLFVLAVGKCDRLVTIRTRCGLHNNVFETIFLRFALVLKSQVDRWAMIECFGRSSRLARVSSSFLSPLKETRISVDLSRCVYLHSPLLEHPCSSACERHHLVGR